MGLMGLRIANLQLAFDPVRTWQVIADEKKSIQHLAAPLPFASCRAQLCCFQERER